MKNQYKIILGFIVFIVSLTTVTAQESKILHNETYKVGQNTKLNLDNQFGNVKVNTWNKPDFSVKVTLILSGLSGKEATKITEKVRIDETITDAEVQIKTELNNGSFNVNGSGKKFEINYEVYIPDNHSIKVKNSFGNFVMQNYNGPVDLSLEYGNLTIGDLNELSLQLAFGNGTIESIKNGELSIEYADKFSVAQAGTLDLNSDFSKVNIEKANQIILDSKYGYLDLGTVNQLKGTSEFSGLKIGRLENKIELKVSYVSGTLKVEEINNSFEKVDIRSEFSAIDLNFEAGKEIPFHITTNFGNFKYNKTTTKLGLKVEEDFDKEYKGTIGKGSQSLGTVFISTSYGNASIDIN